MTRCCKFPGCHPGQTCPCLQHSRRTSREARTWDWDSLWRTARRSRRSLPRNNNPRPHKRRCRSKAARHRRTGCVRIARHQSTQARPNKRTVRDSKLAPPPRTRRKPPSGRRRVRPFRRRTSCGRPCKTAAAVRRPIESKSDHRTGSRSKPARSRRIRRTTPRRTCRAARKTSRRRHTGPSRSNRHPRTGWRHSTGYRAFRTAWRHRLPPCRRSAQGHRRLHPAGQQHRPGFPSDLRKRATLRGVPIATRVEHTPRRSATASKGARSHGTKRYATAPGKGTGLDDRSAYWHSGVISLGSMEHMAPSRARDLAVAAARLAKVRAVIQTKRDGNAEGRDGDLYFLPWAPHRRLLPLCRAVVHHGGAGTSHAVLRAGKPSVVLPFIFEQQLWARRLRQVGAGGRFVSFWKATPERVADQIRQTLGSERMRRKALDLASAMAPEDGTGRATRLLERLAAHEGHDRVPLSSTFPPQGA